MASAKKSPPATSPTETTMLPGSASQSAGIPGVSNTTVAPSPTTPSTGMSSDQNWWENNPYGNKITESAVGVSGQMVTKVDPNTLQPTGEPTYEGYMAPGPARRSFEAYGRGLSTPFVPDMPKVEPRYFTSDVDALASKDRGTIASWQSRMNAAGLLGKSFTLGAADDATTSAYREVLGIANREGVTDEEALALIQQRQVKLGSGSVQRYRLTNPTDIKVAIRAIAQDALGRGLDDGDVNRLVKLFQQEELSAQKKYQAGGVVTDAPSAQQFVQSKIQQDFGEEVSTRKLDQLFQGVDQALGGKQ